MKSRISDILNWFRNRSLAQKQSFYFMTVAVLITAILSTYFYFYSRQAINQRTFDQLTAVRETKKNQIEYLLDEHIRHLRALASIMHSELNDSGTSVLPELRKVQNPIASLISREYHHIKSVKSITWTDLAGQVKFRPADLEPQEAWHRMAEWYEKAMAGDSVFVSDYRFPVIREQEPDLHIGLLLKGPSRHPNDSILVCFEVSSRLITDAMLEYSSEKGFGQSAEVYLVGSDLTLRSESRFFSGAILNVSNHSEATRKALAGQSGTMITTDYRNVRVYSSFAPLQKYGLRWAILSEIDHQEAMKSINAMRNDILFLSVVILLFILSVSVFLASTVVRPILKLEKAVRFFGAGEAAIRVEASANDEIGALTRSFNEMACELNRKTAAIYGEQEKERQRIARELHDGLGQILAGVKIRLENLHDLSHTHSDSVLEETKGYLAGAMDELHRISNNLRPVVLSELGLIEALKNLTNQFRATTGMACELSASGDFSALSPRASNYLYRICQEGLTNVARHAGASWVQIHAIASADHYLIILEDNGCGLIESPQFIKQGNGLFNMKERAMLLGGKLSVEGIENQGTTIRIKIPYTINSNTRKSTHP